MVVRVDEVGHLVAYAVRRGDLIHGALDVVTDGWRLAEQNDAVRCRQEGCLVGAVGDPVKVPLHPADVVALLIQGGAERRTWDWRVVRQIPRAARARGGKRLR